MGNVQITFNQCPTNSMSLITKPQCKHEVNNCNQKHISHPHQYIKHNLRKLRFHFHNLINFPRILRFNCDTHLPASVRHTDSNKVNDTHFANGPTCEVIQITSIAFSLNVWTVCNSNTTSRQSTTSKLYVVPEQSSARNDAITITRRRTHTHSCWI